MESTNSLIGVKDKGDGWFCPSCHQKKVQGVWRHAGGVDLGGRAASTLHIHDPKDVAAVLSISPRTAQANLRKLIRSNGEGRQCATMSPAIRIATLFR